MYSHFHSGGGTRISNSDGGIGDFASSSSSSSQLYRQIKSEEYSIRNRLRSIEEDRRFVRDVLTSYTRLAIFTNLRCGVWYLDENSLDPPAAHVDADTKRLSRIQSPCYFKSTDGHIHHWKFSDTRLNTHLITVLCEKKASDSNLPLYPGAIIIDSTRKGKRYPDSFSRTIPIWCCVWNRAISRYRQQQARATGDGVGDVDSSSSSIPWDTDLHMPTWVSDMECSQIEGRLEGFVTTLLGAGIDFGRISRDLTKPLRCLWMDRSSRGWEGGDSEFHTLTFTPLLLLQCSRVESETRGIGQRQGWSYIQGAGDDEENWTTQGGIRGFHAKHLSKHSKEIGQLDYEEDVIECIRDILAHDAKKKEVESSSSSSSSSGSSSLILHAVPLVGAHALVSDTLPLRAAVTASLPSVSADSLALLYLYFDSTSEVKRQRKEKLVEDNRRKIKREAEHDDDDDADEHDGVASEDDVDQSTLDLLHPPPDRADWPHNQSLLVPISSRSKDRRALLDALGPAVRFIEAQHQAGRNIIIACQDISYISCILTAAMLTMRSQTSESTTVASASAPTPPPSSSSSASISSPSSRHPVDKSAIRSSLATISLSLPSHFPQRILLKQLNHFFMHA